MTRRSLSRTARLRVFQDALGLCHICGERIQVGQAWDVEHRTPLALGGADDAANMSPAHGSCHGDKTKADVARIAKATRQRANHLGIKKPTTFRKPPPGYGYDWKRRRYIRLEAKP